MKLLLYLFYPLSFLYQFLFWWSQRGTSSYHLPDVLVISVGNLTVGGTGKTPFVQYLVRYFNQTYPSYAITILSRGYKAEKSKEGAILPNGLEPKLYGDEPSQHKEMFPDIQVIIGRDRKTSFLSYNQVVSKKHIVILDDGFQHKAIYRDFDFVLLDANSAFGNGMTLPLGFLREPIRNTKRANAIVFTKLTSQNKFRLDGYKKILTRNDVSLPMFHSRFQSSIHEVVINKNLTYHTNPVDSFSNLKYFLVTGVGNPKNVYETAKSILFSNSIKTKFFPDHFEYRSSSLLVLLNEIQTDEILITTEKDWIKMRIDDTFLAELVRRKIRVFLILIQVSVEEEKDLKSMLAALVSTYESKIDRV
ncbi:tetraacyldisaccharide 4'-kinase [Leptospira sp. 2 VSF19]|uniref:Tetraacyldisaccharide 4'-kinase n=1 Tax=Leptospira soteropolitanensis TaxID=2950025 RepID=A0AAW5VM86_9LEPT|nr:tetraacyldisaccharide 4'-kinase [Leptospira soteropolitanensis]MCW7493940.1 tetraacyldisaccharide 4'-kinase [Leptospira soteropolitanensis]MCW7501534.1 tetraacyldisaccharide 4'-kinase [Leptospira soteropolitanensis]MCW7523704.1 tetraacyldisaccharide 4'-kinase [Leptospira soteropolitanensis]MCW7527567.1 tetraacyldisaccharide 4'-kinase [Leptospira soteropolitanensis]MCW7531421.1 tetraacyldisaccharide 4'-kinase [Leptospira soteropolitanensis]